MMHFYNGWPAQGFWGLGGPIAMMIFGALLIGVLIYFAVIYSRNSSRHFGSNPQEDNALDILKKRYARGEIRKEEFESMKNSLL